MPESEIKSDKKIDIKGLVCPYTFVKVKLAMEEMEPGQVLEILLDYPEAAKNIPKSLSEQGQTVIKVQELEGTGSWIIIARKETD